MPLYQVISGAGGSKELVEVGAGGGGGSHYGDDGTHGGGGAGAPGCILITALM